MTIAPWHWRSLPLAGRSSVAIFAVLFAAELSGGEIAVLLDSPPAPSRWSESVQELGRYSICAGRPRSGRVWTPPVGEILPMLRDRLGESGGGSGEIEGPPLPFRGGWLGWLGYDLAWEIEQLPELRSDQLPFPVGFWYEPDCFAVLDHRSDRLWLAATEPADLDRLAARLDQADSSILSPPEIDRPLAAPLPPQFLSDRAAYTAAVRQAQEHIRAGDIFQANLSLRFSSPCTASGWDLYQSLRRINPSPFASYWQTPWGEVVSCSPERLVQLGDRQASTRPIAGTRPRGADPAADQAYEQALLSDPKERAEHAMLVDLERNDLGRVCDWGSVAVDEFFTVERYSHVMHLVSNVTGCLASDRDPIDLMRATFPGGTITGCPKVRCMEIIEALEPVRRSLFYGSCGYLDRGGNLDLNILIRTLLIPKVDRPSDRLVWGQVGAGIVADSDPDREWEESLAKARAQLAALAAVEP
ncbi:MAG: anthranilate synthase component I [Oscillatoriales cyanobacterium]|nr:MAG: anthranilate synthase component I [Oscillatoriales cyanobacterium]